MSIGERQQGISGNLTERIELVTGDNLDALVEELRIVGEERAKYRALFYSSLSGTSISDEKRKMLKAACMKKTMAAAGGKMAANLVEATAYDEPEYRVFVEAQHQQKIAFETLDARYKYLEYKLEVAKQKIYFAKTELGLMK